MPKTKPALSPQAALLVAPLRAIDTSAKPRFDEVVLDCWIQSLRWNGDITVSESNAITKEARRIERENKAWIAAAKRGSA